jgi:hypothetical protein
MSSRFEALRATLREKGANLPCPACGHDAWEGSHEFGLVPGAADESPPGEVAPSGGALESLMDVCLNCGFLRQHMVFILERGQEN